MSNNKWEPLKAIIMAVIVVLKLMPGVPTFDTRLMFYAAIIVPYLPIIKYSATFENKTIAVITFVYFIFYLVTNIVLTQLIKKIGYRWNKEEYAFLKPDQVTLPFILVIVINAGIHFTVYYLITYLLLG